MTRRQRRKQEQLAVEIAMVLCGEAFMLIRASAYLGTPQARGSVPPDVEVGEWIRLLADTCHNLPGSVRPSVADGRRFRTTSELKYLMQTASPIQRDWIAATLERHGLSISAVV